MEGCTKICKESMRDCGIISQYTCSKPAVYTHDENTNTRWCRKHYNQWKKKIEKKLLKNL